MTALYPTLPDDVKRAIDLYNDAVIRYEWAHTEQNREVRDVAQEAMLRAVRSWAVRATIENDEAA